MKSKQLGLIIMTLSALGLAACGGETTSPDVSSTEDIPSSSTEAPSSSTENPSSSTDNPSSSSESSSEDTSSSEESSSSSEEPKKLDIAYYDGTFEYAGENASIVGRMYYWAGDGGTVSNQKQEGGVYSFEYTNTNQFWGVQLFYRLPYAIEGNAYTFSTTVTSDAAGPFRVNNTVYTLKAGENDISASITQGAAATISIQLGSPDPKALLQGTKLSFTAPVINDAKETNVYHHVKFANGNAIKKEIEVLDGKPVAAPADPTPAEGEVFDGWYNGDVKWTAELAISADAEFDAKFVKASDTLLVTLVAGSDTIGTVNIKKGELVVLPADLAVPFGYKVSGWYKEAALTNAWDLLTDKVTEAITLYAKTIVAPTSTYMDGPGAIPADTMSNGTDGEFILTLATGWGDTRAWAVQVNFAPGKALSGTYVFGFEYTINATGVDAKAYDGADHGTVTLDQTSEWKSSSITGTDLKSNVIFTFELACIPNTFKNVVFQLRSITLTAQQA